MDSCWGYYGCFWEKDAHILEEIESEINFEIESRKRKRLDTIKRWVRNRVPLLIRAEMLGEMS